MAVLHLDSIGSATPNQEVDKRREKRPALWLGTSTPTEEKEEEEELEAFVCAVVYVCSFLSSTWAEHWQKYTDGLDSCL